MKTENKPTILVVDDDPHIAQVLEFALKAAGFEVICASDGNLALKALVEAKPQLIILDINLPGPDGLWVCRKAREFSDVPIIFLSARDEEMDRVMGLTIGGDDYVTKPFSPRELVARVEAVLRRPKALAEDMGRALPPDSNIINIGPLSLDTESFEASFNGQLVDLTATEFKILLALASRPKKVFSRDALLNQIAPDVIVSPRTIDSHILHIRKKFLPLGAEVISTQHGLGYSLAKLLDKSSPQ
ncbi:MAG: response regulator transcription factor [Deltaproteobacteria bacterium]|jgi:two-component system OmpR family response regulator|nr:response regulator transcription factor [Deltaproteobacteria bacterium]